MLLSRRSILQHVHKNKCWNDLIDPERILEIKQRQKEIYFTNQVDLLQGSTFVEKNFTFVWEYMARSKDLFETGAKYG